MIVRKYNMKKGKIELDIAVLNKKYAQSRTLEFNEGSGGFPTAIITNKFAKAAVSIYGAHVLNYQPKGQEEVLWMSSQSIFEKGSPIRGGIPVCFPWFGLHPSDSKNRTMDLDEYSNGKFQGQKF
jgi:glucose-6-phosphate 1-epimerase